MSLSKAVSDQAERKASSRAITEDQVHPRLSMLIQLTKAPNFLQYFRYYRILCYDSSLKTLYDQNQSKFTRKISQ